MHALCTTSRFNYIQLVQASLSSKGSWVLGGGMDALEKMGLETFVGYLHNSKKK